MSFLVPDVGVLQADNAIGQYHRMMEQFAGAPPESRGIRTPGEKTAFEVDTLDTNANKMFMDKTKNFETMLEGFLKDAHDMMLLNFDKNDYIQIFDDLEEAEKLQEVSRGDIIGLGEFVAVGAQHWERRRRRTQEMQQFQQGPVADPKIGMHISGIKMAQFYEKELGLEDEGVVEPYIGVKENVEAETIAAEHQAKLQQEAGVEDGGAPPVSPEEGGAGAVPVPAQGLTGGS